MSRFDPALVAALEDELEAIGLREVLDDPEVTDVTLNPGGEVFVTRFSGKERLAAVDPLRLESIIASIAALDGQVIEAKRPILETVLPIHHMRVLALLPPVVTAPCLVLRNPPRRLLTLDDLVDRETLTVPQAEELKKAVLDRETILVSGGVGSGKTTLLSALLDVLVRTSSEERIVILEVGSRELVAGPDLPEAPDVVQLLADETAGVDVGRLLRTALRMNPDRILLGEARGAEAFDFVKACNTGHPGSMLTLHANSATDAIDRLDALAQEAGVASQRQRILAAVDRVVHMGREGGRRFVVEVLAMEAEASNHTLV